MQINGITSGPTMAAAASTEPPEPPPRNPERINASLHKLNEAKNIKSLDSALTLTQIQTAAAAANTANTDKTVNNNRPLKALLSLDNNIPNSNSTTATTSASLTNAFKLSNNTTNLQQTALTTLATATTTTGTANISPNNSTNSGGLNCDNHTLASPNGISNVGSSGGGGYNQALTTAQMTIDAATSSSSGNNTTAATAIRQTNFLNKSDSHMQLMQQQQLLHHQQQIQQQQQQQQNGIAMQLTNGATSSNHMTATAATSAVASTTIVDKRNANDISAIKNTMELRSTTAAMTATKTATANVAALTNLPITMKSILQYQQQQLSNSGGSAASHNNSHSNHCDDNRNDSSICNNKTQMNKSVYNKSESPTKLREENERLNSEVLRLRKLLENSMEGAVGGVDLSDSNSCGDTISTDTNGGSTQQRIDRLEADLRSANSQLMSLRIERKKLRLDKNELMGQIKQLCTSLQDKEQELRDFIRNYNERVRETETNTAKLTGDRERERWQLLKQARDEAERSLSLAQQLSARDMQLQRLQEQLQEARRQLSGCLSDQESLLSYAPLTPPSAAAGMLNQMSGVSGAGAAGGATGLGGVVMRTDDSGRGNSLSGFSGSSGATTGDRNSCSNDSVLRNSSDRESTGGDLHFSDGTCDNGPCITVDADSISLVSSQNMYQFGTPKERSPTLSPLNTAAYSRSVEQLGSPVDSEGPSAMSRKFTPKPGTLTGRTGRGGTWGSISRVFARSRNKSKALSADGANEFLDYSWSPLSEEGYAEKLRLLREAAQIPIDRWRSSQVIAWLEVALGMPQYSTRCAENVKSGKVLLELNDAELETGLGLAHPMHRKKIRLAIEEQRRPELVRYPMITQLGHTWVASEWLPDIGLPQYAEPFLHSLVDARMLDTLSKKELEKFLGVTRKFHQAAIVHGIHVLRIVKYDRQTLAMRRVQSENVDADPIVWTNQRFIRWARSIDLGEYADNLKDSGVHGGLVVLEPSFSGDTMATALGIPPSKNIIRRHLATEFDALILPARSTLGQGIRSGCGIVPITGPGGLQHYATTDRRSCGSLRISAWKGSQSSLSKAFRFNPKSNRNSSASANNNSDRNSFGNSTSPTPSYSSSEGGGGIYATIGGLPHHQHHHHFLPPPTTAPPPPPIYETQQLQQQHQMKSYAPPAGHRISAPPPAASMSDSNLVYQQQRRVKSINDIGGAASVCGGSMDSGASNSPS